MLVVYVLLLLAAAAILGGVVVVAMGAGGEMALSRRDLPPLPLRLRTAADLTRLRLPIGLLGYQEQATTDAFRLLSLMLDERDSEIARLQALVGSLDPDQLAIAERAAAEAATAAAAEAERAAGEPGTFAVGPDPAGSWPASPQS